MSYKISQVIFFIFLGVVTILWYQGFDFFPFLKADKEALANRSPGISVSDVRKLSTLRLDFSLFDDPIYKSLNFRPIRVLELKDISKGRVNPFSQSR